jgi:hypothetical protein
MYTILPSVFATQGAVTSSLKLGCLDWKQWIDPEGLIAKDREKRLTEKAKEGQAAAL